MRPQIADILAAVGAQYGVSKTDILSDRREARVVHARHICFWLAKELTLASYPQIGMAMKRDHTSVMNGVRVIEAKRQIDEVLQLELHELIGRLDNMVPPLAEFAVQQKFVSLEVLARNLRKAVLATGGVWMPPQEGYGDHLFVIDLMGVTASGPDEEEACHNWRKMALQIVKSQAA